MVLQYMEMENDVNDEVLYAQYMWSDPARRGDWETAIRRALADGGLADPDSEATERRWPGLPGTPMEQID